MTDPRSTRTDALADHDDAAAALAALRHALRRATEALGGPFSGDALELVIALDDALEELPGLAAAVPAVLDAGRAGPGVREHLRARGAELRALAELRREHDALAEDEDGLRAAAEEREHLFERVVELRRLRDLVADLPALRAQERALAAQIGLATGANAQEDLTEATTKVIAVGAERMAELRDRVAQALAELRRTEAEWADEARAHAKAERELRLRRAEFDEVRAARDTRLAGFDAHVAAHRDLLRRLGASLPDGADFTEVQTALDQLDRAVASARAERARRDPTDEHEVRS